MSSIPFLVPTHQFLINYDLAFLYKITVFSSESESRADFYKTWDERQEGLGPHTAVLKWSFLMVLGDYILKGPYLAPGIKGG